jgi:hypothetical protein
MIQDKTGFRNEKKVKNINIRKTIRLSKLTVKWIPMLLQLRILISLSQKFWSSPKLPNFAEILPKFF